MGNLPTWDDPDKLQIAIDRYFSMPENVNNPTVCGLALELGFSSRTSIYEYKEREELANIIKKALMRIELAMEKRCGENINCAGAIFRLKNAGWKDKTEQDITVKFPDKILISKPSNESEPNGPQSN
jgi:hypothetical protein